MHRTLLFFITSTFLCAALSTRAQETVDWELRAVECERVVFSSEDPYEANDALVEKAFCYKQCRRFEDAAATLARVKMFMLTPEGQAEVLYEKELCSYLAGDFDAAAAFIDEADANWMVAQDATKLVLDALVFGECGRWDDSSGRAELFVKSLYEGDDLDYALQQIRDFYGSRPELKDDRTAMIRAFLPPFGHFYTENYGEGWLSLALNTAAAGWCVWQCIGGNWISGILGGGIALNYTFMGNQERCAFLVGKYNQEALRSFNASLKELLLSHSTAE